MSSRVRRCLGGVAAGLALLLGGEMTGETAGQRLLVFDVPYESVWDRVLRALEGYPVARAGDGVIETSRVERAPRPDELGVDRVAERVTVRVEATGRLATRVTIDVALEGLRGGRWSPLEDDGAAARALFDRIRATPPG
jgi:hypothetical protein